MVDHQVINVFTLPCVSLSNRNSLPSYCGIYFALNKQSKSILYIGQAENIKKRWLQHHRYKQLAQESDVVIAYLKASPEEVGILELQLIKKFKPPLNTGSAYIRNQEVRPVSSVTLSSLRSGLLKYRRLVQRGEVFSVEYYKIRVGWLMSAQKAKSLNISDDRSESMNITEFRVRLNEAWESLDSGEFDCIWLVYHETPKMAIVSTRIWNKEV